jgi:hypothetical protein
MELVDTNIPIIQIPNCKNAPIPDNKGKPIRLIDVCSSLEKSKLIVVDYEDNQKYACVSHSSSDDIYESYHASEHGISNILKQLLEDMKYNEIKHCWVDAICINQSSNDELDKQIKSMAHIYYKSCITVIYTKPIGCRQDFLTDDCKIGKWFERVWTIQESMFCRKPLIACYKDSVQLSEYVQPADWYTATRKLLDEKVLQTRTMEDRMNVATNMAILNTSFGNMMIDLNRDNLDADIVIEMAKRNCKYDTDRINGISSALSGVNLWFRQSTNKHELYEATGKLMEQCNEQLRAFLLCCPQLEKTHKSWIPTLTQRLSFALFFKSANNVESCVIKEDKLTIKTVTPGIYGLMGICVGKLDIFNINLSGVYYEGIISKKGELFIGSDGNDDLVGEINMGYVSNNSLFCVILCLPISFCDKSDDEGNRKWCNMIIINLRNNQKFGTLRILTDNYKPTVGCFKIGKHAFPQNPTCEYTLNN